MAKRVTKGKAPKSTKPKPVKAAQDKAAATFAEGDRRGEPKRDAEEVRLEEIAVGVQVRGY